MAVIVVRSHAQQFRDISDIGGSGLLRTIRIETTAVKPRRSSSKCRASRAPPVQMQAKAVSRPPVVVPMAKVRDFTWAYYLIINS